MGAIRLGIIGAGWGANHARVAAELSPLVEVRALCARRPERMAALAAELGLPRESCLLHWEELVRREDVDLVVVTAPDALHCPITLAAVTAGKHVFCEKPLAMDAAQAKQMLQAAERAGVAHFTGFTWRFAPPFATIRRLIEAGALGTVQLIDAHFRIGPPLPGKEWQLDPEQRAGGVLGNLGVHLIDLARFLAGRPGEPAPPEPSRAVPWRVWAHCELRGQRAGVALAAAGDPRTNDVCWLHLEAGAGRPLWSARLQVSQVLTLRASDPVRVEVHGTEATAIGYANPLLPERQRVVLLHRISQLPEPVEPLEYPGGPPAPPTAALPSGGLLRPTIRHLYEAHIVPRLAGGRPAAHTPTFRDGWIAQRVMDAALRSAARGEWQAV